MPKAKALFQAASCKAGRGRVDDPEETRTCNVLPAFQGCRPHCQVIAFRVPVRPPLVASPETFGDIIIERRSRR